MYCVTMLVDAAECDSAKCLMLLCGVTECRSKILHNTFDPIWSLSCLDMVCLFGAQVKAELNYSDLLTATDMVCSTAFDRDDEFFATAGVFRRVKIFDFASVQESGTSIHYPVLEIPSRLV